MKNNHRLQMLYQKNDFNNHQICQLSCIFKCCKCKKNNTLMPETTSSFQLCLFCGTPNAVKREMNQVKNLR